MEQMVLHSKIIISYGGQGDISARKKNIVHYVNIELGDIGKNKQYLCQIAIKNTYYKNSILNRLE